MILYDAIVVFNVDSKAECVQLNLAHVVKLKCYLECGTLTCHRL